MSVRSYLFVPGDRPEMLEKANSRGADALIVDLEDAVSPSRKRHARETVSRWLAADEVGSCEVWLRPNAGSAGRVDLEAISGSKVAGVIVPKVETAREVAAWVDDLAEASPDARVIVLVETAKAMRGIDSIASVSGVSRLMLGEADLGADVGLAPDGRFWDSIRLEVALASAASGLGRPIGPVFLDLDNSDQLEADTLTLRALGFGSRAVVHPSQIDPVRRAFTPTQSELDDAHRIISEFERSADTGNGVIRTSDGRMVDIAVVRRSAEVIGRPDPTVGRG